MSATITIDLSPVLLAAGPLVIRWYGLMISLAIVAGVALALRETAHQGVAADSVLTIVIWAIPCALVGARLVHVIDGWEYYATYPLRILSVQDGGLAIYGGLVGGLAGGALAAKRLGLLSWGLLDMAAPSLILGQAIGRIGCFINGDHQGAPSTLPWATSYVNPGTMAPDSLPRHPTQLYELLFDLALFSLLWMLRGRVKPDGVIFALYAGLYSFGRFWISALREDAPFLMGMKEAQVISILVFLGAALVMGLLWHQPARVRSDQP